MVNICIREYNECDIQAHCNAVISSLTELSKWFTWAKPDYCLCDSYDFIVNQDKRKQEKRYDYAIVDKDNGEFLGGCGLRQIENGNNHTEMSYWIRTDKSSRGVMKDAVKQLKHKGCNELKLREIEIHIAYCNPASKYIAENIGAIPIEENFEIKDPYGGKHRGTKYIVKCESKSASK